MSPRLKTTLVPTVVAIIALLLAGCAAPPATTPVQPSAPTGPAHADPTAPSTWQNQMLVAVNEHRAGAGVAPVAFCGRLGHAAQAHSEDQAATGTMSHVGSDGSTLGVRATRAGYVGWNALAENVAAGQPDVSTVLDAWMNSAGHRQNMLNATYTHLGLGKAAATGTGTLYWTQKFGRGGSC